MRLVEYLVVSCVVTAKSNQAVVRFSNFPLRLRWPIASAAAAIV
jgi:hypothetical protein